MKLKLHTVSPVHIGTGNSLEPYEYIIEDGIYYRLDQNKAFKLALKSHPDFPDRFSSWVDNTAKELRRTKDNRQQAKLRSNFNLKYFCETVLQDSDLGSEILEKGYSYKCEAPFDVEDKKQISELMKDGNHNLFIPGSSIKGSLRTILAWQAFLNLDNNRKQNILRQISNSNDYRRFRGRGLDDLLEQELFICGKKKRRGSDEIDFTDIKFDLMKFIRVTDAVPINAEMALYPSNLYLTDKSPQGQTPALEVIEFNSSFEFEIKINEEEIRRVYEASMDTHTDKWVGFDKKFKNLFCFYPHEIPNGQLEDKIVEVIKYAVTDFYKALFGRETKWLANFKNTVVENKQSRNNANIDDIKEFYEAYEEIPTMLRIGWASGFISTTIFDALLKDPASKTFAQELLKHFKIGIPQNRKRDPNVTPANVDKFPKSKRFTAQELNHPLDPFGWVALMDNDETLNLE